MQKNLNGEQHTAVSSKKINYVFGWVKNSRKFHASRLEIIPKTYFLLPKTVISSSKAHNMQPLVHARVTEN